MALFVNKISVPNCLRQNMFAIAELLRFVCFVISVHHLLTKNSRVIKFVVLNFARNLTYSNERCAVK